MLQRQQLIIAGWRHNLLTYTIYIWVQIGEDGGRGLVATGARDIMAMGTRKKITT